MLGWMIVFALITVLGALMSLAGIVAPESVSMKLATVVFGVLFLACVLTRFVRDRA